MRNVYPFLLSSRLTGTFATPQPVLSILLTAEIRRSAKRNTWQPSTFLLRKFSDGTTDLHEVTTPGIAQYVSINSSGVVAAFSGTPAGMQDALLLFPVQLTNKADPTIRNGANGNDMPIQFLQSSTDTNIGAVAWIAGNDPDNSNAPRMPDLQAQIGGANGLPGSNVYWKLQVIFHDRFGNPHRDFDTGSVQNTAVPEDTVTIPIAASLSQNSQSSWHKVTNGTPWNIFQDPDWQEEVNDFGFFGGDATLSLIIMSSDGSTTLLPQTDMKFRIAGENSDPAICEAYINSVCGPYWYLYAIAKW